MVSNGEDPTYVSKQLGHADASLTAKVYAFLIPGVNKGAANRLEKFVFGGCADSGQTDRAEGAQAGIVPQGSA